jgi:F420-non-reducing hydrogenase small subunit
LRRLRIAVLDINEKILDVIQMADIVFWPVAMDIKYKDVENMPDKYIDITFFNGSIRNSEQEHMAKLLRQKSKTLVAFGSCAHEGCIPGLANLHDSKEILEHVYLKEKSVVNPEGIIPKTKTEVKEGALEIPEFYDTAKGLIHGGKVDQGVLNKVEMALRAYDPCFACATHVAVGQMPLTVEIYDHKRKLIKTVKR